MGIKMDFLPSWIPLISNKTNARATLPNSIGHRNLPAGSHAGPQYKSSAGQFGFRSEGS